ncbi:MAG: redox-regulated ATPase YchF [Verrucomicrobia bacterium]|nr:redox-regulated ATPase YchF [Verrucomicrobiota bacterium]MCH8529135.1 redox-regulated ATPase YchF [Kiritimatiellia bacterium]
MEAGIVGLPNVGKSTLFNALTEAGAEASNYPFCTIEPNVGIVNVPDPDLDVLRAHIETEKVIPATTKIVDIAGLVKGASEGAGLGNKFLSHIRDVDAILQVVRCFEDGDVTHVDGSVDAIRDVETIETELMLADLQVVENSLQKAKKQSRTGDKQAQRYLAVLEKCYECLSEGKPIRSMSIDDPEDRKLLRSLSLISAKRVLYIANVNEDEVESGNAEMAKLQAYAAERNSEVIPVCAKIESELSELEPGERQEMLESLGMTEPVLNKIIRGVYHLLGLQSYYTAGPKEIRAWTVRQGSTAPQAAGVIHGDFERGFIRANIYSIADLTAHKTEHAIKEAGKLRVEGKEYVMRPGDVCHFLFNV